MGLVSPLSASSLSMSYLVTALCLNVLSFTLYGLIFRTAEYLPTPLEVRGLCLMSAPQKNQDFHFQGGFAQPEAGNVFTAIPWGYASTG